jgi:signal transduction histidine kinase
MVSHSSSLRFVWPFVPISVGLIALCSLIAVVVFRQQAHIASVLRENIRSRRAAAALEESLIDLCELLRDRAQGAGVLHERIDRHLAHLRPYVDHDEERALYDNLLASYQRYRLAWERIPPPSDPAYSERLHLALVVLETDTLKRCQELRDRSGQRIEDSAEAHRRVLRELAWGIAGVGLTGGIAGVLIGFLVARGVERSIRRLQVHIQDAAGKLGQELPAIVLTGEGQLDQLQGQMQGLVGHIEEVVGRLQQREREVRRAEQLAAVGQLAAGVAHEMRNPLTSIKMLIQAGREPAPVADASGSLGLSAEDLEVIEHEIRRMEKSLQTFLTFARPARPERRQLDLIGLVERTVALVRGRAERQNVVVERVHAPGPLLFHVDGEQLHQVLVNLCLNALDAMPQGGRLRIGAHARDDGVEIQVRDTGPGIAADVLPRLFQPFVSSKETGLGLGLSISRRIVEDHGGTLTADNLPGGGACLSIRLPAASGQRSAISDQPEHRRPKGGPGDSSSLLTADR